MINILKEDINEKGFFKTNIRDKNFDILKFAAQFGEIMPQYGGELEFLVKPDPNFKDYYYSLNKKSLFPHTEAYEFEKPPRYILFHSIVPDKDKMGYTSVLNIDSFINDLDLEDLTRLKSNRYLFKANTGLTKAGLVRQCRKPMLDSSIKKMIFRFSFNNMSYPRTDTFAPNILMRIVEYYYSNKVDFFLEKGDLLILDNYKILHSRSSFNDPRRTIKRVWVS